jgi:HdeA/HdeB family
MNTRLVPVLLALWLASCAPQAQQPVQTAAAPPPAAVPAPPPSALAPSSEAQIAPGLWEVERVRCSDLLGADDDDRAAAAMFYYGYLAAKAGIHVIDVGKIDENVGKVMKHCAATPNITVAQAFREALRPRRSPG